MAILDRIATLDKFCSKDIQFIPIFIISVTMQASGIKRMVGYSDYKLLQSIGNMRGNSFAATVLRVGWSSYIYQVWKERNSRKHYNNNKTTEMILKFDTNDVRRRSQ